MKINDTQIQSQGYSLLYNSGWGAAVITWTCSNYQSDVGKLWLNGAELGIFINTGILGGYTSIQTGGLGIGTFKTTEWQLVPQGDNKFIIIDVTNSSGSWALQKGGGFLTNNIVMSTTSPVVVEFTISNS
jgi:hypothetical protein